jgi:chaperonin GroEL (HSP60 family)
MPESLSDARVLVIDDSLEPEEIEEEALATESGFQRYLALGEEFKSNLIKIVRMGINLVIVDKGISDIALEILSDAKVMVLARVSSAEVRRVCEHTGAKAIKRSGLKKPVEELGKYLGRASTVYEDPRLEHVMILGGHGKPAATILVGATTEEVREERERICTDAASSVQAAIRGGVVSGGGAMEIALSREVDKMRSSQKGMQAYGLVCVVEALKRPLSQILLNAGFNPLEKVGDVIARQTETGNDNLAVDCDTGDVADMWEIGVVDPAPVKTYALKAAQEIACAILRIDTIIKKRDESGRSQPNLDQVEETDF